MAELKKSNQHAELNKNEKNHVHTGISSNHVITRENQGTILERTNQNRDMAAAQVEYEQKMNAPAHENFMNAGNPVNAFQEANSGFGTDAFSASGRVGKSDLVSKIAQSEKRIITELANDIKQESMASDAAQGIRTTAEIGSLIVSLSNEHQSKTLSNSMALQFGNNKDVQEAFAFFLSEDGQEWCKLNNVNLPTQVPNSTEEVKMLTDQMLRQLRKSAGIRTSGDATTSAMVLNAANKQRKLNKLSRGDKMAYKLARHGVKCEQISNLRQGTFNRLASQKCRRFLQQQDSAGQALFMGLDFYAKAKMTIRNSMIVAGQIRFGISTMVRMAGKIVNYISKTRAAQAAMNAVKNTKAGQAVEQVTRKPRQQHKERREKRNRKREEKYQKKQQKKQRKYERSIKGRVNKWVSNTKLGKAWQNSALKKLKDKIGQKLAGLITGISTVVTVLLIIILIFIIICAICVVILNQGENTDIADEMTQEELMPITEVIQEEYSSMNEYITGLESSSDVFTLNMVDVRDEERYKKEGISLEETTNTAEILIMTYIYFDYELDESNIDEAKEYARQLFRGSHILDVQTETKKEKNADGEKEDVVTTTVTLTTYYFGDLFGCKLSDVAYGGGSSGEVAEKIKAGTLETGASIGTFEITAYCSCCTCCHPYDPGCTGKPSKTASGTTPIENQTIAVDPSVIPLGTKVIIDGNVYIAEDTGGAIKGMRIDMYFASHQTALQWGRRKKEVFYFKDVDKNGPL